MTTLTHEELQALNSVLIDQLLDATLDAATLTRERDDALAKLTKREAEFLKLATESEGYREALEECVDSVEVMRRALDHKGDKSLSWTVEGVSFVDSRKVALIRMEVPTEVENAFDSALGEAPYRVTISKIPGGAK